MSLIPNLKYTFYCKLISFRYNKEICNENLYLIIFYVIEIC